MKKIRIEWKHFDKGGKTCERCSQTGDNLSVVIKDLQNEFYSRGIDIQFQETKLPESRMAESNQILINGVLLENLIPDTKAGENFCSSCSDLIENPEGCQCRIVNQGGYIHEEVSVDLIKQAIISSIKREPMSSYLKKGNV